MKTLSLILTYKTFPVTYRLYMIPSGGEICKLKQVRIKMSSLQQKLNPTSLSSKIIVSRHEMNKFFEGPKFETVLFE